MSSQYAGDPTQFPEDFPVLDDGDNAEAATIAPAKEALGDRTAWLRARVHSMALQNWQIGAVLAAGHDEQPVIAWVEGLSTDGRWVIAGEDAADVLVQTSPDGRVWTTDNPAGTDLTKVSWIAAKLEADAPTLAGAFVIGHSADETVMLDRAGTWLAATLPEPLSPTVGSTCGVWSTTNTRFVVGGSRTGNNPTFWHITAANPPVATNVGASKVNSTTVKCMAVNHAAPRIVAFGDGVNADSWYSDDGGGTWALVATTIDNVIAIAYSAELATWMLLTSGDETWTSTTGISGWTLASTLTTESFGTTLPSLATGGGMWVTSALAAGHADHGILFSVDAGVSWRFVKLDNNTSSNDYEPFVCYSADLCRFGATALASTDDDAEFHRSLSVGLVPEVT